MKCWDLAGLLEPLTPGMPTAARTHPVSHGSPFPPTCHDFIPWTGPGWPHALYFTWSVQAPWQKAKPPFHQSRNLISGNSMAGPQAKSISNTWELVGNAELWPHAGHHESYSALRQEPSMPRVCEKCCFTNCLISPFPFLWVLTKPLLAGQQQGAWVRMVQKDRVKTGSATGTENHTHHWLLRLHDSPVHHRWLHWNGWVIRKLSKAPQEDMALTRKSGISLV